MACAFAASEPQPLGTRNLTVGPVVHGLQKSEEIFFYNSCNLYRFFYDFRLITADLGHIIILYYPACEYLALEQGRNQSGLSCGVATLPDLGRDALFVE